MRALETEVFSGCASLRAVELADDGRLGDVGEWAFGDDASLLSIVIPSTVTNIGRYAFYRCYALKSVVFEADAAPAIGSMAFEYIPSDAVFYIHEGATKFTSTVTIDANAPTAELSDDGDVYTLYVDIIDASLKYQRTLVITAKVRGGSATATAKFAK